MNIRNITTKDFWKRRLRGPLHVVHFVDYAVFVLFCFLYLNGFQSELLHLTLRKILPLPFCPPVTALVVTLLLTLLKWGLNLRLRLKGRWHAVSFLPSFFLLTWLTAWGDFAHSLWLLLLFVVCLFIRRVHLHGHAPVRESVSSLLMPNQALMLAGMLGVVFFSNTDDVFHYRLRMERLLAAGSDKAALRVARREQATSASLTRLRIYALTRQGRLGEYLFEYPMPSEEMPAYTLQGEDLLGYLSADSVRAFNDAGSQGDLILCEQLLAKNLQAFVDSLPRYYDVKKAEQQASLPKHYREALILYKRRAMHPTLVFRSAQTEANYRDFMELCRKYPNPIVRSNYARRMYGNTYFWYYYFGGWKTVS